MKIRAAAKKKRTKSAATTSLSHTPNEVSFASFGKKAFMDIVERASGCADADACAQVAYLYRYCERDLGAKGLLHETRYTCRHYVDEFAAYYSRNLYPPANHVHRLHVFDKRITDAVYNSWLIGSVANSEDRRRIQEEVTASYLGFITLRPIPGAPVGRTVLRRMDDEPRPRGIFATVDYSAHLAGLDLSVRGLAFQQQDLGVSACATVALWTALSRVARHEQMRAPTPSELTQLASESGLAESRSLPATAGLTMSQLAEATRRSGFDPEHSTAITPELFTVWLHTYLLSGIPVVLSLYSPSEEDGRGGGHAVTAVGFQLNDKPRQELETWLPVRSARIEKLYVHDDRVGPYARAHLVPVPPELGTKLVLQIDNELWRVDGALAPVYRKLRLSVESLLDVANDVADEIDEAMGTNAVMLNVEFKYARAADYLRSLVGAVDAGRAPPFLSAVVLSRWCAIIRWFFDEQCVLELVYDTTDVIRPGEPAQKLLRAVVARDPGWQDLARSFGERFNVPWL